MAAVAVTVFIALFSTIYVQMASGDDPALGTGTTAAATSSSSSTTRAAARSRTEHRRRDHPPVMTVLTEACESFDCFGSTCTVLVAGAADRELGRGARRDLLLGWHDRFTRFDPTASCRG